jgi:molybdopterin molybdotransferase
MPQFLKLKPPFVALDEFLMAIPSKHSQTEIIPTPQALGRVLAEDVFAPHPLPEFPRSTVDGYAVQSASTGGASESLPAFFKLVGEVPMGKVPAFDIGVGEAALIHTGGMIPNGADAVVMLEQSQSVSSTEVELLKAVGKNENVILAGEDVQTGDLIIPVGKFLRIPEIGGLMSIGKINVSVAKKPRVGILSSGDEVVPAAQTPMMGQVRDINSTTMSLLIQEAGGEPVVYGIVPDKPTELLRLARIAFAECDLVLITAGSSASERDMTADVIRELGTPGILSHGVSVRPGKPTILAVCNSKPVIGLPGNPVSALVIASIFVKPVIHKLLGQVSRDFHPAVKARVQTNFPSLAGREDWVPVSMSLTKDGYVAEPIFFKSNLIYNLVRADGLVHIPADLTGIQAGDTADVEIL